MRDGEDRGLKSSPAGSRKGVGGVGASEMMASPPVGGGQDAAVCISAPGSCLFITVLVLIHLLPHLGTGPLKKVGLGLGDDLSKA